MGMVAYGCNPNTKAEEGGRQIQGQYRLDGQLAPQTGTAQTEWSKRQLRIFAKLRRFQRPLLLILL